MKRPTPQTLARNFFIAWCFVAAAAGAVELIAARPPQQQVQGQ